MRTLEFQPDNLGKRIFQERYAIHSEETWSEACTRVSSFVSGAEKPELIKHWQQKFYNELVENRFMPGGRIWYGCGRLKPSLANCFSIPVFDSREGWGQLISDFIIISGLGGGVGINFGLLRPKGTLIAGTGGQASGAISCMRIVDAAAKEIRDGGSRRAAALFALDIEHPDIEEFISEKMIQGHLSNANMSVCFENDPEEFFAAVKENKDYELKWGEKVYKKLNAKETWNGLVNNAMANGEPGFLNMHYINKMNNGWYYEKIRSCNPCSEVPLEAYNMCVLGSIILPRFVDLDNGSIDWDGLSDTVATAIRFLDDVITVTHYPMKEIEQKAKDLRRIGLGILGLYDFLALCHIKYGSKEALDLIDKVLDFIKTKAYDTSILLAAEKGVFPAFNRESFLRSNFIKTLKHSLKTKIKDYGIRNMSLLAIAPNGTISLVAGFSSGIEPIIAPVCKRTFTSRDTDQLATDFMVNNVFLQMAREKKSLSHFASINDLIFEDHLKVLTICQKHIDSSVSKTCNFYASDTAENASDIIMEYFPSLKGMTVYKLGSRENEPIQALPLKEAKEYIKQHTETTTSQTKEMVASPHCHDGMCDLR